MRVPRGVLRQGAKMAATEEQGKNARPEASYRAYLLRCWQEAGAGPGGEPAWRFSLVRAGAEERQRGFARLEDLVAFLQEELGVVQAPPCGASHGTVPDRSR